MLVEGERWGLAAARPMARGAVTIGKEVGLLRRPATGSLRLAIAVLANLLAAGVADLAVVTVDWFRLGGFADFEVDFVRAVATFAGACLTGSGLTGADCADAGLIGAGLTAAVATVRVAAFADWVGAVVMCSRCRRRTSRSSCAMRL